MSVATSAAPLAATRSSRDRTDHGLFRARELSATTVLVAADGKIYLTNEDGEMLVVGAGATFKLIATSTMGETVMATPALSDGVMFVRGASTLFAIGRPGTQ